MQVSGDNRCRLGQISLQGSTAILCLAAVEDCVRNSVGKKHLCDTPHRHRVPQPCAVRRPLLGRRRLGAHCAVIWVGERYIP